MKRIEMKSRRGGFTLLELMFVVAIVAILSAIAIPAYAKYSSHSKQAEVTTNLANIALAEQAFFAQNGYYSDNFAELGFEPQGNNRYAYTLQGDSSSEVRAVGLAPACTPGPSLVTPDTSSGCGLIQPDAAVVTLPGAIAADIVFATQPAPLAFDNTGKNYTALAQAQITNSGSLDVWGISSNYLPAAVTGACAGPAIPQSTQASPETPFQLCNGNE